MHTPAMKAQPALKVLPQGRRFWIEQILPLTLMLLAVSLLYRRILAGRVLAGGDLHTYFFPYWVAVARALHTGHLPLWSPYLFAGTPLLSNSQLGVFYPFNWPFWALCGTSLAGVARALHWNLLLHLGLAAFGSERLARRLGVGPWGAALSGVLYAGSGYLGLHVEHLNQLQALAWLPWVLMPAAEMPETAHGLRTLLPTSLNVLAFTLILLAGHTQMAFIAGIALAAWRLALAIRWGLSAHGSHLERFRAGMRYGARSLVFFLPFALAVLIAAAQLLPTLELVRFSMRSGGLPWREAVSFSVRPWDLPRALLPLYLSAPLLPEGVAYVGIVGMALAGWGIWDTYRRRDRYGLTLAVLGFTGLFLALGAYNPLYLIAARLGVPGVIHFRAPARFLALYVLATALLAGKGLDRLATGAPAWRRWMLIGLCGLAWVELLASAESLPHAAATALRTYTDLRPATAHLVAATRLAEDAGEPAGRFLSISKTLFDAGDETAIAALYGDSLSEKALWAYNVTAKQREVLSPNFPLAFEVPAVDGYDGGLLPLRYYGTFSQLFLPGGTLDGRLRENLETVPEARWLSLMGVRFVITDKTGDTWADDIFYDRQFQPRLEPGETLTVAWLPEDFAANALGILYTGTGEVVLQFGNGETISRSLPLNAADTPARVPWENAQGVVSIVVRAGDSGLALTGASLVDERTAAFYPLVLSAQFRLAHSGDVKVYENLDVLPRAFLAPAYSCVISDEAGLQQMQTPGFDPAAQAIVSNCDPDAQNKAGSMPTGLSPATVTPVSHSDTGFVVDVTSDSGGLLILTDAWYPGWTATLAPLSSEKTTPKTVTLLRADLLFKAVSLAPGAWRATFTYRPAWLFWGAAISVVGLGLLFLYDRFLRQRLEATV
ncbi:MAG: hypothetical protein JXA21_29330 [Anaerolineae bacterium]|nr:hypothetical protein [Anaerolineae bacterium]